ncbi:hypothetical protein LCGC14_3103790, partial [marine sediment metagenome]
MKTIKELQKECHRIAIEKGFWESECPACDGIGKIIIESRAKTCLVCKGKEYIPRKRNGAESIALMHSELSEALEEMRKGNDNKVGSELADCVIRIMDYCEARNI